MVGSWTATSQRKKNNVTCRKSSKLSTLVFVAPFIGVRAGVTVLLEWVGHERRVVGWESRWTEECVGWVGEGRTGGWMGGLVGE